MECTRGVILIHSAPAALCPHIEWTASAALGAPVRFDWTSQPVEPRTQRAEASWSGKVGQGAALTSALTRCDRIRFEVTEEATSASEGMRWAHTPRLGTFSAPIGLHGDLMIHELRLKRAIRTAALGGKPLAESLAELLGTSWDEELEAFRHASEDAPVRWLHRVG